ncbi:AI-2E family transporter [Arthrobacter sp. Z1-15]
MSDESTSPIPAGPPRATSFFLMVAGIVITLMGLRELSWLFGPVLLTAFVIVLVYPICTWLTQHGIPRPLALSALLLLVFGLLAALLTVIIYSISRLASLLPEYSERMQGIVSDLAGSLSDAGIRSPQAAELLQSISLPQAAVWLTGQIPPLVNIATLLVFTGTVLVFLGIEASQMPMRAQWLWRDYPILAQSLAVSVVGIRRFIGITTVFAVIVGVLDTIFLILMGIPLALLWGILAAVCNYIPYLGFLIGMTPPAILALLLHGWESMLLVVIVYVSLNFIITSVVPAKVIGDAVGLSMVVEVVCIVFWSWILGPIGAILAVPVTIVAKAVLVDSDPRARWLHGFVSSGKLVRRTAHNADRPAG